jgi:hypothetical protein
VESRTAVAEPEAVWMMTCDGGLAVVFMGRVMVLGFMGDCSSLVIEEVGGGGDRGVASALGGWAVVGGARGDRVIGGRRRMRKSHRQKEEIIERHEEEGAGKKNVGSHSRPIA